jgi:hypothetical protein
MSRLTETESVSTMYGAALGLCVIAKAALVKMHGLDGRPSWWFIQTVDGSRPEDTVPPPTLFAARFIAAYANGDFDTTLALFRAALTADDPDLWPACMTMLLTATGEAVRAATPRADR